MGGCTLPYQTAQSNRNNNLNHYSISHGEKRSSVLDRYIESTFQAGSRQFAICLCSPILPRTLFSRHSDGEEINAKSRAVSIHQWGRNVKIMQIMQKATKRRLLGVIGRQHISGRQAGLRIKYLLQLKACLFLPSSSSISSSPSAFPFPFSCSSSQSCLCSSLERFDRFKNPGYTRFTHEPSLALPQRKPPSPVHEQQPAWLKSVARRGTISEVKIVSTDPVAPMRPTIRVPLTPSASKPARLRIGWIRCRNR